MFEFALKLTDKNKKNVAPDRAKNKKDRKE